MSPKDIWVFRIVQQDTGKPAPGVPMTVLDQAGNPLAHLASDAEGVVQLPRRPGPRLRLRVGLRSEEPIEIIEDILQGAGTDVEIDPDRRTAIGRAISLAEAGDVVVIAGKGHEQGQEVAGAKLPFDDRQVARELLRERVAT